MRHPLESRIARLRGQVRRLLALHGLSIVTASVVLAVITAGLMDWSFHLAREVRLAVLIAVAALGGWLFVRQVLQPLLVRFRDLEIALRIEQRWPGLNDRLASTLQFLAMSDDGREDEDLSGSRALRDATVAQTLKETETLDFRQVIDRRPVRKAWLSALGVAGLALAFVIGAPASTRTALDRLLRPFGSTQWPKQTHLSITQAPKKVARGSEISIEVAVAPEDRVPNSAKITYRFDDGESTTEPMSVGADGRFRGRIESANRPFKFTVAAGDDVTAPRRVEVVPPPILKDMALTVTPPAYTGVAPIVMAPGRTQIQAVRGSKIEVSGHANKPLAFARLHRLGVGASPISVALGSDGRTLSATFDVSESGPYVFDLKDTEGFTNREDDAARFEVRALVDEAPHVVVENPSNDRDVTANAEIPVKLSADDDFGLANLRLLYVLANGGSEPSAEVILPLWAHETGATAAAPKHQEFLHNWDLTSLELSPGAIITFHADSRDFDNVNGPNLGKSRELRLRVVSLEEMTRQIEAQRRDIRDVIARTYEMQKQAISPTEDARRTLDQTNELDAKTRDNLNNAVSIQRQVTTGITGKADGLQEKIHKVLEDLKNLKIDKPEIQDQMKQMQATVDRIRDNNLGPAEQNLTRATKAADDQPTDASTAQPREPQKVATNAQPPKSTPNSPETNPTSKESDTEKAPETNPTSEGSDTKNSSETNPTGKGEKSNSQDSKDAAPATPASKDAKDALARANENQEAIAGELKAMLDELKEFDTYKGVVAEVKNVLKAQENAMKEAADAAENGEMAGKSPENLTPQERSNLENVAAKQNDVAESLRGAENKMDEMAGQIAESDPDAAEALKEAAQQSREQGTASKMNKAGEQLQKNQMGAGRQNQEQARQDLKSLLDTLENRREHQLARLVKDLKKAQKDLAALKDRQQQNKDKTGAAKQIQDEKERAEQLQKLAKEQEEIQKELKRQLQKLQKLRADAAAKAGAKAAAKMAKAQENQEADEADDAEAEQEDALANLDDAEEELDQARKEAEEQLAMEQLTKLADSLKTLSERQDKLVAETIDYDKKREADKPLTPAQRAGVKSLGRVESALRQEADDLTARLEDAPVFALILKRASAKMDTAAERLQNAQPDDETQAAAQSAATRFKQLLEAIKPDKGKGGEGGGASPGGRPGGGAGGGGGGDGITTAAQIKMLKLLQQEVNDRTEALDEIKVRKKTLTADQEAEVARLQDDQRGIADLARDLTNPKHDDGEED